jgi:DNA ligase 1
LIRSLEGKLRISLAEKTVLLALAHASASISRNRSTKDPSTKGSSSTTTGSGTTSAGKPTSKPLVDISELSKAEETVKQVFSELPSYDLLIPALLEGGWQHLREKCKLTPGVPLKPMLAKPTKSISEVLDRFEGREFTCEYKYDGERAQIHYIPSPSGGESGGKGKGEVKVYSRNSEDMSKRYPDIVEALGRVVKVGGKGEGGFVLDCECVAWDAKEERYSFQISPYIPIPQKFRICFPE